jgi:hypothetical protein
VLEARGIGARHYIVRADGAIPVIWMAGNPETGQKRAWRRSIAISSKPTSGLE